MLQAQHRQSDLSRSRSRQTHHANSPVPWRRRDRDNGVIEIHAPIVTVTLNINQRGEAFRKTQGEDAVSVADELLKANEEFARNFKLGELQVRPKRHVAVLACMDSRILFEHCLGLKPGDAHMIRNAGGIATDDALRSLIVSHHLLDTQEFIIINHTDCGLLKVREDELKARLTEKMGTTADEPSHFHAFDDLEANVQQQMQRVKSHPWIPKNIPVRGFVYDVKTGKLKEVEES
jgi:carbonic anhydrase